MSNLRHEMVGQIIRVSDDPYDPEQHAWVDVVIGDEIRRFLVTQRFRQENDLYEGEEFSWKFWRIPLFLNFLLHDNVQDITKDFPQQR